MSYHIMAVASATVTPIPWPSPEWSKVAVGGQELSIIIEVSVFSQQLFAMPLAGRVSCVENCRLLSYR